MPRKPSPAALFVEALRDNPDYEGRYQGVNEGVLMQFYNMYATLVGVIKAGENPAQLTRISDSIAAGGTVVYEELCDTANQVMWERAANVLPRNQFE